MVEHRTDSDSDSKPGKSINSSDWELGAFNPNSKGDLFAEARNLDSERFLYFSPHGRTGFCNQMECFNIAALLAAHHNRTLVIPRIAYRGTKAHDTVSLSTDYVFESIHVSYLFHDEWEGQYRQKHNKTFDVSQIKLLNFRPSRGPLLQLHHPLNHIETLRFKCQWGFLLRNFPLDYFPDGNKLFYTFHSKFERFARETIIHIHQRHGNIASPRDLVTLHIRLGDKSTFPMLSCQDSLRIGGTLMNCLQPPMNVSDTPLSWKQLLNHSSELLAGNGGGLVAIATNRPQQVKEWISGLKDARSIVLLDELLNQTWSVNQKFLVEQWILSASGRFIPGWLSSITEQVIRIRLAEQHPNIDPYDKELNLTFWERTISLPL